jgi:hypothetical protein
MMPSLATHLPMLFIDDDTGEPVAYWVDRDTGERIYLFHLDAVVNDRAAFGPSVDERLLLNGYTEDEAFALLRRAIAECPRDTPERERITALTDAWKEQQA